ncbi:unnamed protein product [Camellia sinensis]
MGFPTKREAHCQLTTFCDAKPNTALCPHQLKREGLRCLFQCHCFHFVTLSLSLEIELESEAFDKVGLSGYCFRGRTMAVGVLALQGSFNEHIAALRRLGVKGVEIRKPEQLQSVTSLIIPGEHHHDQACRVPQSGFPALREFVKMGRPVCGTCAGLIFLANKACQKTGGQELIGGLDCTVHRNFFGSQVGPEVEVVADITITSNKTVDPNSTLESQE